MPPQHSFDWRTQLNYTVWHNDPTLEAFVRSLIETVKPTVWVETGTHMGWTSWWVARNFPNLPIYTVEVDDEYFAKSCDNLAAFPQITVRHGSSADYLRSLVPLLRNQLPVFWLDAHWWPPVPLREECHAVAQLDRYVCLLDDFACYKPNFGGDAFTELDGSVYFNDLSYVASELGKLYWRPVWTPGPDGKGVGLFIKDVPYIPPPEFMRQETFEEYVASRPEGIYPMHPSVR